MKPRTWFYCFICCLVVLASYAPAQPAPTSAQWAEWRQDPKMDYKKDHEGADAKKKKNNGPSFLERFTLGLFSFLASGAGAAILWTLLVGGILFVGYKLVVTGDSFLFAKKSRQLAAVEAGPAEGEEISFTNWETMQQHALDKQDLRLAVRYTYLGFLRLLEHGDLIRYKNDKTNADYDRELLNTAYKAPFRQLSRQYEAVWYGHYPVTETSWNEYQALFEQMKKQLYR